MAPGLQMRLLWRLSNVMVRARPATCRDGRKPGCLPFLLPVPNTLGAMQSRSQYEDCLFAANEAPSLDRGGFGKAVLDCTSRLKNSQVQGCYQAQAIKGGPSGSDYVEHLSLRRTVTVK